MRPRQTNARNNVDFEGLKGWGFVQNISSKKKETELAEKCKNKLPVPVQVPDHLISDPDTTRPIQQHQDSNLSFSTDVLVDREQNSEPKLENSLSGRKEIPKFETEGIEAEQIKEPLNRETEQVVSWHTRLRARSCKNAASPNNKGAP